MKFLPRTAEIIAHLDVLPESPLEADEVEMFAELDRARERGEEEGPYLTTAELCAQWVGMPTGEDSDQDVRARERGRFFREFEEGLLGRTDREKEEDAAEQALWDQTSADGLEDE